MTQPAAPAARPGPASDRPVSDPVYQSAKVSFAAGKRLRAKASVKLTTPGLLAVGGLVSAILLSTTLLVRVAVREGKRPPL